MNQYKIFQKSIHYQVILRMINMRLCLLQKICCRMCAIAAFKRSFLKIIISCLPIHFPSSSKKIFRFTFLLGFGFFAFFVCTLFTKRTKPVTESWCQTNFVRRNIYSKCFFLYFVFLHWYSYLKDNYISL